MKTLICILSLILFGCNSQTKNDPSKKVDTVITKKQIITDKSILYAKDDSVIISSEHFDTLIYPKEQFDQIVDNFPSLYLSIPVSPDISYAQSGYFKEIVEGDGDRKIVSFGSEQGQDIYYILYSYFLRQKQGEKYLDTVRENLIAIYQNLNDLFGRLSYGGTFFGHQYNRVSAYAEYGVYEYESFSDIDNKVKDIRKLKQLYLASLREITYRTMELEDEIYPKSRRIERQKELLEYVATLDKLINSNFYLKKAQKFQYSYY